MCSCTKNMQMPFTVHMSSERRCNTISISLYFSDISITAHIFICKTEFSAEHSFHAPTTFLCSLNVCVSALR